MPREKLSLKSAGWLSIINLGLALVGILQTIVIARVFGASREIEIYFAATTFLMLMMKVSSAGQIGDLFTTIFHDIKTTHGRKARHNAFSVMTNAMTVIAVLTALFGWLFCGSIARVLAPGFEAADLKLCATLFAVTSSLVIFQVVNGWNVQQFSSCRAFLWDH